jgi:hypothetical protein
LGPEDLEGNSSLGLLITTKLKLLASLEHLLVLNLANAAFQTEHNLLGSLGLFVENRFGLTTISRLLTIVATLS